MKAQAIPALLVFVALMVLVGYLVLGDRIWWTASTLVFLLGLVMAVFEENGSLPLILLCLLYVGLAAWAFLNSYLTVAP